VFIVERSAFKLTRNFYIAVIVLLAMTGSLGFLFTMHVHVGPSKKSDKATKNAPEGKSKKTKLSLENIPACDLPPLPNRQGPHEYKGYPYYSYPNGDVDGFTQRGWWRLSLDEFKRHVDRLT